MIWTVFYKGKDYRQVCTQVEALTKTEARLIILEGNSWLRDHPRNITNIVEGVAICPLPEETL